MTYPVAAARGHFTNVATLSPASLTIQPAAAAGKDSYILATSATTNFGNAATIRVGNEGSTTTYRGLIQFDLSPIPMKPFYQKPLG